MKTLLIDSTTPKQVFVKEDSQYVLDTSLGAINTCFVFDTQGVVAQVLAAADITKDTSSKVRIDLVHKVSNTTCKTLVKNVLRDNASAEFIGKIVIAEGASNTSSFLYDHALVIGENTSNNSQPELQIDANDVKASHGATTGKINKDHLYYLMSRGLSKEESEHLIIKGFLFEVLDQIEDKKIRDAFIKRLKLEDD